MSKAGDIASKSVLAVGTAAVTGTVALVALVKSVSDYSKEIKIASEVSGEAAEELQVMAHATATVGIDMEKLGDIAKDTREKIGDFLSTGGGGFQDFADAMGLTKKEAEEMAKEFAHLSGPEILQEMVTRMEDANVSAVQMSHALEGMASDTTRLIPLLKDGGIEMKRLSDSMAEVITPLTDEDIKTFTDMGESVDRAGASFKSFTEQQLLDNSKMFMRAADAVAWYFSTLNEGTAAWNKSRLVSIGEEIEEQEEIIRKTTGAMNELFYSDEFNSAERIKAQEKINELLIEQGELVGKMAGGAVDPNAPPEEEIDPIETKNSKELQALIDRFKTEEELLNEKYAKEVELAGENKTLLEELEAEHQANLLALKENNSLDAIAERFMSEQELLKSKLDAELEIVGENKELRLQLEQEYIDNLAQIEQNALDDAQNKKDKQAAKDEKAKNKLAKEQDKERADVAAANQAAADKEAKLQDDAIALAGIVFEDSKEVSAAIAAMNTAEGVTHALKKEDYIGAATVAAAGAVQISAILSTTKGGGSSSSSSSVPSEPAQEDFEADTTSLDVSSATSGGSSTQTLTFATDTGDDLMDLIAKSLNDGQQTGKY